MKEHLSPATKKFVRSIWFFPAVLTLVLIILSALQINGSSMGAYHTLFYGNQVDENLLLNKPLSIRSDEWTVNTQKAIAQKNNNFAAINKNLGNGEDVTLLSDVPYRDWSIVFKPHNLGFFVLPFDTAFALRWWAMSYLLVLSCYFFILAILPSKRWLAVLLSLGFLFSPFFQWWYLHGTLGTVYYGLFGLAAFIHLIKSRKLKHSIGWAALLTYMGVCFAFILYPPFQIPCAIVLAAFAIGYFLDQRKKIDNKLLRSNLLLVLGAFVIMVSLVGLLLYQKKSVIDTIQHTAYPGQRIVSSGGYDIEHLLSSQLSPLFQSGSRAASYFKPNAAAINQSESSNFILLLPFLIIPAILLSFRRRKVASYTLIALSSVSVLYLAWLTIPGLDLLGKVTLLDKVPLQRLLIGIGLLNLFILILVIKQYEAMKWRLSIRTGIIASLLVFIYLLLVNFHVLIQFPQFISYKLAVVLAIPIAAIVFCLIRRSFITAALLLLLFSIASTFKVNPLYIGTTTLSETPISQAIRNQKESSKKWVTEEIYLENFPSMNGKPSLSGTYLYPQLEIWKQLDQPEKETDYNRYAHVGFTFDRDPTQKKRPILTLVSPDQFNLRVEPCDEFLKKNDVGFLITSVVFEASAAPCATLEQKVTYPRVTLNIYRLSL